MAQRDDKFFSELKQLNQDLLDYMKKCLEKSPYFNFTPTFKDYCKQFEELESKYPQKTVASQSIPNQNTSVNSIAATSTSFATNFTTNNSTTSAPIFGSAVVSSSGSLFNLPAAPTATTSTTSTSTSSSPFIFGAPSLIPKPTTTQPFLFGSAANPGTNPAPFFSFSAPKKDEEEQPVDAQGDDDDEHQPPEPKVDKYEEPDSTYSVKCKLYEKGNKTSGGEIPVNLLGIGVLYVKSLENSAKLQVIVRQEPDLRRVLLNEVITPNIPVKLLPKAVQMIFPGSAGENKFYIAKVKDEGDANTLHGYLNLSKS